jgi:hypothetical protein
MSPGKGAKRLLSADGGVWSLNVAIVAASALLLAGPVQHLPEFEAGVHIPWWGLALGFLAAERCVVHLHFRRSAHSFSLGDLPLVFGLLFATPLDLVIAGLVGPIVVLLVDRRLPAIKVGFNIAQFTLTTCLAVIVFHELAATVDGFGPAHAARRFFTDGGRLANQGLTPNDYINPATGEIDYTRSRWSRSRWSEASELLPSSWSRSSWSMAPSEGDSGGAVDLARSSWSRSSWSTSWTK